MGFALRVSPALVAEVSPGMIPSQQGGRHGMPLNHLRFNSSVRSGDADSLVLVYIKTGDIDEVLIGFGVSWQAPNPNAMSRHTPSARKVFCGLLVFIALLQYCPYGTDNYFNWPSATFSASLRF